MQGEPKQNFRCYIEINGGDIELELREKYKEIAKICAECGDEYLPIIVSAYKHDMGYYPMYGIINVSPLVCEKCPKCAEKCFKEVTGLEVGYNPILDEKDIPKTNIKPECLTDDDFEYTKEEGYLSTARAYEEKVLCFDLFLEEFNPDCDKPFGEVQFLETLLFKDDKKSGK